MNNEQQQIIDEAYENYKDSRECQWTPTYFPTPYTQEEFIDKCKTDNEFSEKWGLKIEERGLSLEERNDYYTSHYLGKDKTKMEELDRINIPTKLITVTYKEQTITSYE